MRQTLSINNNGPVLLAYSFRPFFLLAACYACLIILYWLVFMLEQWSLPLRGSPLHWHSHEMLYGFVSAAIAGFLLTAITNWTGSRPLAGLPLLALILLWLAGRLVLWLSGWLPPLLVAVVDLAFLPTIAVYVASVLLRHNNRRNLILVAVLALLALGNLLMHIGFVSGDVRTLQTGELLGLDVITLMMALVAGRITPAFSANWLKRHGGNPAWIHQSPRIDIAALASIGLLILLDTLNAPQFIIATTALVAGLINGLRLVRWAGWRVWREPLLWVLHLAYGWIVLALLLRGASFWINAIPATLWQHTLGVGGMATLILGVMTRVAVGHTGRPLKLAPFGGLIYLAIIAATLLRLLTALQFIHYPWGLGFSALMWILAFGLFVALYLPILVRPRIDGRPG